MSVAVKLSGRERAVLVGMLDCPEENCMTFAGIAESSGLPREHVRRAVRSLARKGFAYYAKGLWSEYTNRPAGAGYGLTEIGRERAESEETVAEQDTRFRREGW